MQTPTLKSVKVLPATHKRFSQIKRMRKQSHQILMDEASKLLMARVRAEKCTVPNGSHLEYTHQPQKDKANL